MAVTQNLKGTSFPRFTIGKNGPTILQGNIAPESVAGVNGDLFLQMGSSSAVWQKQGGNWIKIGGDPSRIINGTTQVAVTSNSVDMTVLGQKIFDIKKDVTAIDGEKLTLLAKQSALELSTFSNTGTDSIDVVFQLQGEGKLKVRSDAAASLISNEDGEEILIQPGLVTDSSANDIIIAGGDTDFATGEGGSVLLKPGTGTAGNGSVLIDDPDYVPSLPNSVMTRKYANINEVLINSTVGTVNIPITTNFVINNVSTANVSFVLSDSVIDGTIVTIKDATGTADTHNITITAASSTIDGAASYVISEVHAAISLLKTNIGWFIV